jgi:pimeloyl-ACP methyl ester carboxylesterase
MSTLRGSAPSCGWGSGSRLHSWGGHLALRLAAAHPERLLGVLAVDPLGIVGDGGMAAFDTEMARARRVRIVTVVASLTRV